MIKHIFTFDDLSPIKNILIEDIVVKNMRSYQQSEKGLPEACGILMGEKRGINQEYLILNIENVIGVM